MKGTNPIKEAGKNAKDWWTAQRGFSNLIVIPAIWAVVSMLVTGVIYSGADVGRYIYEFLPTDMPEPFSEDRLGILVARLENDPDGEYTLRVRTALEQQLPMTATGEAAVEVDLYPKTLELPAEGRLSQNIANATKEGRTWLEAQNAELLIWGRAVPTEKQIELRILTRQPAEGAGQAQPEVYPLRIPTEFSDRLGATLAGVVAGAGYKAWNQRGKYLTPEQREAMSAWMDRLKSLRGDLPDALDAKSRERIREKIETAYFQIGAALVADSKDDRGLAIIEEMFGKDSAPDSWPSGQILLVAEMTADYFEALAFQGVPLPPETVETLLKTSDDLSGLIEQLYGLEQVTENEFLYFAGDLQKLDGHLTAKLGRNDEAREHFKRADRLFKTLMDRKDAPKDPLSVARIKSYLGSIELSLASLSTGEEAAKHIDAAITDFGQALNELDAEVAPREVVRVRTLLSLAYNSRWRNAYDARALYSSAETLEPVLPILRENQRIDELNALSAQMAILYGLHSVIAGGEASGQKALAAGDAFAKEAGADETPVKAQSTFIECLAYLGEGRAMSAEGDALSGKVETLEKASDRCEKAATLFEQLGNPYSWMNAKSLSSSALRIAGKAKDDVALAAAALGCANDAAKKTEGIDDPVLANQNAYTRGAALREVGRQKDDVAQLEESVRILRDAHEKLMAPERNATIGDRLPIQLQLGDSLVTLAAVSKDGGKNLEEGIEMLDKTRDAFASGGAALMLQDATEALDEAKRYQAEMSVN
ncbi:hypothetical protein A7A08_02451 [Methyloligella halotolerans]|uniref:Tetratricopeptide repeat protein n=1 Tax=Methyloligella halotolerans TaxID=1177755 RepID=A0A1E2RWU8_9HYPH|nr:hypothetical protein [Methyloligella halotolerans]ODA66683.1 hypothetical protein A7A08_02451 [Methyloligella halotolerans]